MTNQEIHDEIERCYNDKVYYYNKYVKPPNNPDVTEEDFILMYAMAKTSWLKPRRPLSSEQQKKLILAYTKEFKDLWEPNKGVGVSTNSVTTTNKSIIERMVPVVDAMNIAHLKLQKELCKESHGTKPTSIDPTKE